MALNSRVRSWAVVVVLLSFTAVGCMKHTFITGGGAPQEDANEVYSSWHSHWLFGIIGNKEVDIKKVCPSGHATIYERTSFVNGLIGALVGLIYYPTTVTVYCRGGHSDADLDNGNHKTVKFELTREQAARIAASPKFMEMVRDLAPEQLDRAELAHLRAQRILAAQR